jgi:outer membrane immunogenic protein
MASGNIVTGSVVAGGIMKRLLGVVASVLFVASMPAGAADLPPLKPVPPVPFYDWNGFYAGAGFSYHSGRTDDVFTNGALVYPITRDTFHGSFGSIDAGYCRMAASPVVLCGEAAIDLGRARGTNYGFTTSLQNTAIRSTSTIDWMVTVGPKLGLAIDANQLFIYASGGGAFAHLGVDATSNVVGAIGSGSASGTQAGWYVGAGMERLLTPNVGVKFDYRRVEFKGLDTTLTGGAAVSTSRIVDNVFSAGFNYHFTSGYLLY